MRKTLVAFMRATCAEGSVTVDRAYNCTVAFTADGDYNLTIGKGGADVGNMIPEVETELAVGNAVGSVPNIISTSDTVKRLQFRTFAAGVLTEPVGFGISIYRLGPAPVV